MNARDLPVDADGSEWAKELPGDLLGRIALASDEDVEAALREIDGFRQEVADANANRRRWIETVRAVVRIVGAVA